MFRRAPPPPPPAHPSSSAGMSTNSKGSVLGSSAALAALAHLRAGLTGKDKDSPASMGAAPGATHVRRSSRRQSSKDMKELKLSAKELKAQAKSEKLHSRLLDQMLAEQSAHEKRVVKILLLGPGESGKSTLFKQVQRNYGLGKEGFDVLERRKHLVIVVQNVVRSIKSLLYHSERLLQRLPFSALSNQTKAASTTISPSLAESKAYIEACNLYKMFEGAPGGLTIETQLAPGETPAPPSPEISPIHSRSHGSHSTSSTVSAQGERASAFSYSNNSSSLSTGGHGHGPAGTMSPPPPVGPGESLINMQGPAASMYAGQLHTKPSASAAAAASSGPTVKLNPSGRFVPQVLTRGSDGRSAADIFHEILTHCFLLWSDPGLKCTFENRAHFDFHQLFDSDSYFLHKLATGALLHPEYIPSEEDLIRVRIRTTAINSMDFQMKSSNSEEMIPMRMLDVAGQRSERKKWIPYFQDATAVIFVAALSEYDQVLAEDGKTNRLLESVHLFTEIMNSKWFEQTPLVLFLNKCDLFAEKLRRVPLNVLYPKYSGSSSYQTACEFLCREFVKRRANPNKVIHIHVVSAIQVDLIKTAMDSVKTMLIESSLQQAGLMQ